MYKRETINYVKGEQIMTETFGHSKDLITLSLSLSLSLKYSPTITYTLLRLAGTRVNIRLFLQTGKGGRIVFYPHWNVKLNHHNNDNNNDNEKIVFEGGGDDLGGRRWQNETSSPAFD